ncbi:MAG: hypothetical protein WC373_13790 [Smithella sp.]|jgi:hypothetical protein
MTIILKLPDAKLEELNEILDKLSKIESGLSKSGVVFFNVDITVI